MSWDFDYFFAMGILTMQWNATNADSEEFKRYVTGLKPQPDVLCIQTTGLNACFQLRRNMGLRKYTGFVCEQRKIREKAGERLNRTGEV